ncbi:MAG: DUF5995 family protein [Solirubrobacteraceae bacterium]
MNSYVLSLIRGPPSPWVLPIRFAVAGTNAHINYRVPIALIEQWQLECVRPSEPDPAYRHFCAINPFLSAMR